MNQSTPEPARPAHVPASAERSSSVRWLRSCGALLLALAPTVAIAWDGGDAPSPREAVLARLTSDPTVLINVTAPDMPSTTDILNLGRKSTPALQRCLSDNVDDELRRQCAEMLGWLGDRAALPTLRAAVEDWHEPVRWAAMEALGRIPEPASVDALVAVLDREGEPEHLKAVALVVLGQLGAPAAVTRLRAELRRKPTEGVDRRASAFAGLWASRHLMARGTLTSDVAYALDSGEYSLVRLGTDAAAELRESSLVRPLTKLLDHADSSVKNRAVRALGLIGSPAATKVLLDAMPRVRDARMLNNIAFALQRLDAAAFHSAIGDLLRHPQAVVRLNAAYVVGDVKYRAGLSLLVEALGDPNDYVRASAAAAIGRLEDPAGIAPLEALLDDGNPSLRELAVYSIDALVPGGKSDLVFERLVDSPAARRPEHYAVRLRAMELLGRRGDPRVRDELVTCFERYECGAASVAPYFLDARDERLGGRLLQAWVRGRSELTSLLAQRRPAGAVPLALAFHDTSAAQGDSAGIRVGVDLLGALGDPSTLPTVQADTRSPRTWTRLHALAAAARLGDAASAAALLTELDGLAAEWMDGWARIVGQIDGPARDGLRAELEARAKQVDEPDRAVAAARVLLRWDADAGLFLLLDHLASPSARLRQLSADALGRDRRPEVTAVLRRALAREGRPAVRDLLRALVDDRA